MIHEKSRRRLRWYKASQGSLAFEQRQSAEMAPIEPKQVESAKVLRPSPAHQFIEQRPPVCSEVDDFSVQDCIPRPPTRWRERSSAPGTIGTYSFCERPAGTSPTRRKPARRSHQTSAQKSKRQLPKLSARSATTRRARTSWSARFRCIIALPLPSRHRQRQATMSLLSCLQCAIRYRAEVSNCCSKNR